MAIRREYVADWPDEYAGAGSVDFIQRVRDALGGRVGHAIDPVYRPVDFRPTRVVMPPRRVSVGKESRIVNTVPSQPVQVLPEVGIVHTERPVPSTGLQAPVDPPAGRPEALPIERPVALPTKTPARPERVILLPGVEHPWEEGLTFEEQRAIIIHNQNVRDAKKPKEPKYVIPEEGQEPVILDVPIEPQEPITEIEPQENTEMAVDWGTWTQDLAGDYLRSKYIRPASMPQIQPTAYVSPGAAAAAGTGLGYLVEEGIDMLTGEKKKCRRRRRRLLTPTDLGDLAQLQALVGKGEVMKVAVMKALSRR